MVADPSSFLGGFSGRDRGVHSFCHKRRNSLAQPSEIIAVTVPKAFSATARTQCVSFDFLARKQVKIVCYDFCVGGHAEKISIAFQNAENAM